MGFLWISSLILEAISFFWYLVRSPNNWKSPSWKDFLRNASMIWSWVHCTHPSTVWEWWKPVSAFSPMDLFDKICVIFRNGSILLSHEEPLPHLAQYQNWSENTSYNTFVDQDTYQWMCNKHVINLTLITGDTQCHCDINKVTKSVQHRQSRSEKDLKLWHQKLFYALTC